MKDNAITAAFHKLTIKNSQNVYVDIDTALQAVFKKQLNTLLAPTTSSQKQHFTEYDLYLESLEEKDNKLYCWVSDARDGYPETIYKPNNDVLRTNPDDIRSKKFFISFDFSNPKHILLCNQYLGTSGCYGAVEKALAKLLSQKSYKLESDAIITNTSFDNYYENGVVKYIYITYYKPNSDVAGESSFNRKGTICISPVSNGKNALQQFVSKIATIFTNKDKSFRANQDIVKDILKISGLDDGESVSVINNEISSVNLSKVRIKVGVKMGKNLRTFDLLQGDSSMATRYDVENCKRDSDNNPDFNDIKEKTDAISDDIKTMVN